MDANANTNTLHDTLVKYSLVSPPVIEQTGKEPQSRVTIGKFECPIGAIFTCTSSLTKL